MRHIVRRGKALDDDTVIGTQKLDGSTAHGGEVREAPNRSTRRLSRCRRVWMYDDVDVGAESDTIGILALFLTCRMRQGDRPPQTVEVSSHGKHDSLRMPRG